MLQAMKYQLIYHSYADANITNDQINDIIEVAKGNNSRHEITGCLLYHNKQFIQMLEGEQNEVQALFDRITQDPRHSSVQLVHKEAIEKRTFKAPMAFDVVDKDDFEYIGAVGSKDLEFIKNDLDSGKKLFAHISHLIEHPVDKSHSKPFGPSA